MRLLGCLFAILMSVACGNQREGNFAGRAHSPTSGNRAAAGMLPPRYFVNAADKDLAIELIAEKTEPAITIDGHYSRAIVPCGTECTAFWIIDRDTGAVIDVPEMANGQEVPYDLKGNKNSDIVEVTYGSRFGSSDNCVVRTYRLAGVTMTPLTRAVPTSCP